VVGRGLTAAVGGTHPGGRLEGPLVVSLGDLMTDVVAITEEPTADGSDTRSLVRVEDGGAAANTAAWLAATGHRTAYVGRVGDDLLGRAALDRLAAAGVVVRAAVDPTARTGTCVVVVARDRTRSMYPDAGANAHLSVQDVPLDLVGGTGPLHLHVSGYALLSPGARAAALAAMAAAGAAGHSVSVDPASAGPIATVGTGVVLGWLAGTDLVLANQDEACLLAGGTDPMDAGARLAADLGAEVVVKLGPGGAAWFRPGAEPAVVPAEQAVVVDTTGAGDAFAAGFLPSWLAGADPADALRSGCRLAARVVARVGARPPG
jgi:sugar/nucleoside kinase (ribokinase family)